VPSFHFFSGFTILFLLLLFLERGGRVDSYRTEAGLPNAGVDSFRSEAGLPNVGEERDLFSKETLLQHKIFNDDQQEYFRFDCKNKAEGLMFY